MKWCGSMHAKPSAASSSMPAKWREGHCRRQASISAGSTAQQRQSNTLHSWSIEHASEVERERYCRRQVGASAGSIAHPRHSRALHPWCGAERCDATPLAAAPRIPARRRERHCRSQAGGGAKSTAHQGHSRALHPWCGAERCHAPRCCIDHASKVKRTDTAVDRPVAVVGPYHTIGKAKHCTYGALWSDGKPPAAASACLRGEEREKMPSPGQWQVHSTSDNAKQTITQGRCGAVSGSSLLHRACQRGEERESDHHRVTLPFPGRC